VEDRALEIIGKYKAVFDVPPHQIPADCAVDAPLLGNGDLLVALGGGPEKLQFYIGKNDLWVMKHDKGSHPVPLARLDVDLPGLRGAPYHVEQDLLHAITVGHFQKDGATLNLETAVASTENLLWVRLSAQGGVFRGQVGLFQPGQGGAVHAGGPAATRWVDDVQALERRFEEDVTVPAGAACAVRLLGGREQFAVEPGKPVIVIAVVRSRFDEPDFMGAAINRAAAFTGNDLAALWRSHEAWWRDFWGKSFVEIPDKVLEQRYYLSQYVLASASRLPDFPPGLFGWVTTDRPMWYGDYHMNYNHVAPFYALCAANHVTQADPCHGPILAAQEVGRQYSQKYCDIKGGILLPVGIGPKGSVAYDVLLGQKTNSAYSCVPLANRWYATYDPDFGRKAYPFVRDTAYFWEQWLKYENGRYVDYHDAIHENSGDDVNPILALGLVRMVMNLALDMSKELGVDASRREKWAHIRDHLSDYPSCTVRDLPPQFWPKHLPQNEETLNLAIFRYTERGMPWCDSNTLGIQHIFPANGIGLDSTPEMLQRARNQIRVLNRWRDGNGMNSIYAAAGRVGYDPNVILRQMRAMLDELALPNGMIRGNPHGMEHQSIVPNAIQEMLMQSYEGALRFFPCWPKERDARFGNLRAAGAFLVSAELKNGLIRGVKIVSEKGRGCVVVNPWPGTRVQLIRNGVKGETLAGDRFAFKTAVNETVELQWK
jgi:hypothetical protein